MAARCTCDSPCCEADVGVGIITCGSQHCTVHGEHAGEEPRCFRCQKPASEFDYTGFKDEDETNEYFVRTQEGTYNRNTNTFACDACYIAIGCPTVPGYGWKAPAMSEKPSEGLQ